MNETLQNVAATAKALLDQGGLGQFNVSARVTDGNNGGAYLIEDGPPAKSNYHLSFLIQNNAAESNPAPYKHHIISAFEKLSPLAPYVDFKKSDTESKKDHLAHLTEKFEGIRAKAATAGLTIPETYGEWFKQREKLAALQEGAEGFIYSPRYNAFEISRNDVAVTASVIVPSGMNADDLQKEFNGRADAVKSLLGRMTAKKLSKDPAEQAAIAEKIKKLDMLVTTQSFGNHHTLNIEFHSPEVTEAMKKPGGLQALKPEEVTALKATNPLMQLKDGDGLTPENPADMQKAIARALLFEGEKGEKPIALFSKIAGSLDMKVAIEKSMKYIKATKPELAADVDIVLQDNLFKDHSNWQRTKTEDGKPIKHMIRVSKRDDANYVEGQFAVDISIPADKLPEVLNQLATLAQPSLLQNAVNEAAAAAQQQSWVDRNGGQPQPPRVPEKKPEGWLESIGNSVGRILG